MGIFNLYNIFFKKVEGLKKASIAVFKECKEKKTICCTLRAANITGLKMQSKIIF